MSRLVLIACGLWVLAVSGCPGSATLGPGGSRAELEPVVAVEVERLANGARVVAWPGARPGLELGLFVMAEPEREPLGLEGASRLLVEVALEAAGEPGGGRPDRGDVGDEASPRARALALGGRLEAHVDGALIGWRLVLRPCPSCGGDRIEKAWELLLDVALAPELRASTVTRRAEQWRDRLLARVDTMERAALRWGAALAVGVGRPSGSDPTEEAAANTNREALVRLHRALMSPERIVLVGPALGERSRARLVAWTTPTPPGTQVECVAPPQLGFGLVGVGVVQTVVARRAPGLGVMGRLELEAALLAARRDPVLGARRVELVDLGGSAALVEVVEDGATPFEAWLEAAVRAATDRVGASLSEPRDVVVVAKVALFGRALAGVVTLGQPVTVWWGEADRFPTVPVILPREAPLCRGR